jgi:hypothetical protein
VLQAGSRAEQQLGLKVGCCSLMALLVITMYLDLHTQYCEMPSRNMLQAVVAGRWVRLIRRRTP